MERLEEIFCEVDDFCHIFIPHWQQHLLDSGQRQRQRACRLRTSEIMTLLILFHQSSYRCFKHFYLNYASHHLREAFPDLLSYTRFLAVMPRALIPLCAYFTQLKGQPTGIAYIDSTTLKVCHNIRIPRHRVFKGIAGRGKSSMGGFYGFKLHLIINHLGEIIEVKVTPGNTDDRKPVPALTEQLSGTLYGDRGYISKALENDLATKPLSLKFITTLRKNMKARVLSLWDQIMLKKRFIIETINDQLKNISFIEHSRHRSLHGFMINLTAALIAYCLKPNKPALDLENTQMEILKLACA